MSKETKSYEPPFFSSEVLDTDRLSELLLEMSDYAQAATWIALTPEDYDTFNQNGTFQQLEAHLRLANPHLQAHRLEVHASSLTQTFLSHVYYVIMPEFKKPNQSTFVMYFNREDRPRVSFLEDDMGFNREVNPDHPNMYFYSGARDEVLSGHSTPTGKSRRPHSPNAVPSIRGHLKK
ncbi:hypothetical protein HY469_05960 [Candidatus Roizmanbacteria bacterium]|nr:hypothetical protein [Candidatus Roizmanbacteria bacterium]